MTLKSVDDTGKFAFQVTHQGATAKMNIAAQATTLVFGSNTRLVRLASNVECWYMLTTGTATAVNDGTNTSLLPAGQIEYRAVTPGETMGVVAGTATATGYLSLEQSQ